MLKFKVTELTVNGDGPVAHLLADGGPKIELYLPKGFDVPAIGDNLVLVHDSVIAKLQADMAAIEGTLENAGENGATDPTAETPAPELPPAA